MYDEATRAILARFWPKVNITDCCWLWIGAGARSEGAYGSFKYGDKVHAAHRVAYEIFIGPIPPGMFVCHDCDVKLCVNPAHLHLGTPAQNNQEIWERGLRTPNPPRAERSSQCLMSDALARALRADRRAGMRTVDVAAKHGVPKWWVNNAIHARKYLDEIEGPVPRSSQGRRKAA